MVRREVTVRRAELSDCAALAAIDAASNSGSWGEGGFAEFLGGSMAMLLLAETEGEIAGFIACELQGDLMAVDELAVAPNHRRMGIATTLMEMAEAVAREMACATLTLEVRQQNIGAIAFYQSFGFAPEGIRKNLYSDPPDHGVVMTKKLICEDK